MCKPMDSDSEKTQRSKRVLFLRLAEVTAFLVIALLWFSLIANRSIFRWLPDLYFFHAAGSRELPGMQVSFVPYPWDLYVPELIVFVAVVFGIIAFLLGVRSKEIGVKLISGSGLSLIIGGIAMAFLIWSLVAIGLHYIDIWEKAQEIDFMLILPPDPSVPYHLNIPFWPLSLMLAAIGLNVLHLKCRRMPAYELRTRIVAMLLPVAAVFFFATVGVMAVDTWKNYDEARGYTRLPLYIHFGYASNHGYFAAMLWSLSVLVWAWGCRLTLLAMKRRYESRADYAMCDHCGYDLRGTIHREKPECPECGEQVKPMQAARIKAQLAASQRHAKP